MQEYAEGTIADGPNGALIFRGGRWVPYQEQGGPVVVGAPPQQRYEAPQAEANLNRTQAQTQADQAALPYVAPQAAASARNTAAQATKNEIDAQVAQEGLAQQSDAKQSREIREAFKTDTVLKAIRNARRIAQNEGGTEWGSILAGIPGSPARKLQTELDPLIANLGFDRLQQMRDESPTGGAVGSLSDRELRLLSATVSSLDTAVDLDTFLRRLDEVERHFMDVQLTAQGVPADENVRAQLYREQFDYSGVSDSEIKRNKTGLTAPGSDSRNVPVDPEYQAAYQRYLRDNWGSITPEGLARFRSNLDEQFGYPQAGPSHYLQDAQALQDAASRGASPDDVPPIPPIQNNVGAVENAINTALQHPVGSFAANAGNALGVGLPALAAGKQDELNLLGDLNPRSSFAGELGGAIGGTVLTGGALGLGARAAQGTRASQIASKPLTADVLYGGAYGATQGGEEGAALGVGGALAGNVITRGLGRAFPQAFAPGATRAADESVPTVQGLKDLAADQYAQVQRTGVRADGEATRDMYSRALKVLEDDGLVTPQGRMTQVDGPVSESMKLLEDYAGRTMRPQQANTVRKRIGDGLTNPDPAQRRTASRLAQEFDEWVDPTLPGISVPRETSRRYIQGQQLEEAGALGNMRGARMKGNDAADSTRTIFGQLDEKITKGRANFDPATADAIAQVARGNGLTNALRSAGKFGLGNPLTAGGVGVGGTAATIGAVDPIYASGALGLGVLGTGARRAANAQTMRHAEQARLTALGGEDYLRLLDEATAIAQQRAGRVGSGLFGVSAQNHNR